MQLKDANCLSGFDAKQERLRVTSNTGSEEHALHFTLITSVSEFGTQQFHTRLIRLCQRQYFQLK